nr:aftiphilin isoform X1 [Ciona intestinalis]XP_026692092.1 aftiphilin isoform X1 [Ciona intestinalis]XP_026692093.1 aftiphilin isoform X1 [Ciona intestinalis]|eukprot:XP_002131207.1 aftiphilin isoform X1 [Ciona intestinalis]
MSDFIPIVSNSPPPIDITDDEDDFTDFRAANDHWESDEDLNSIPPPMPDVSDSDFDSPVKKILPNSFPEVLTENGESFKSSDVTVVDDNDKKPESFIFADPHTFKESKIKQNGEVLSIVDTIESSVCAVNSIQETNEHMEKYEPESTEISPDSDQYNVNSTDQSEATLENTQQVPQHTGSDTDFGDFGAFKDATHNVESSISTINVEPDISVSSEIDNSEEVGNVGTLDKEKSITNIEAESSVEQFDNDQPEVPRESAPTTVIKDITSEADCEDENLETSANTDDPKTNTCHGTDYSVNQNEKPDNLISNEDEFVSKENSDTFVTNDKETEKVSQNSESVEEFSKVSEDFVETEDNFANFQIAPTIAEKTESDNDDFNDFANFESFPTGSEAPVAANNSFNAFDENTTNAPEFVNESNDFAAFASPTNQDFSETNEIENPTDNDDFGDFGSAENQYFKAEFENSGTEDRSTDDGNDFGDFGSFEENTFPAAVTLKEISVSLKESLDLVFKEVSNLKLWFPVQEKSTGNTEEDTDTGNTAVIKQVHDHIEDDILDIYVQDSPVTNNNSVNKPSALWDLLEDVDNAIALKFQWNGSDHNRRLIESLGIKTQNILFSGTAKPYYVPTYASGLGLLEPSKELKPVSAAEKITAISPTDKVAPVDGDAVWETETGGSKHVVTDACHTGVGGVATSSVLDSCSLDLDFFDKPSPNASSHKNKSDQDKIDPELLQLAMKVTPDTNPKKPDPLSKILASLGVASSRKTMNAEEDEDISEEGRKVLQKLPDLSFMRSTVLMFPLQSKISTTD